MPSPLINRLIDELDYPLLDKSNFEQFVQQSPYSVLLLTEKPKRFPESDDVAVILPELIKQFPQLSPAVISQDYEKTLQGRYNFNVWPALVFLKEGRYLSAITKVQDWDAYIDAIRNILALEPKRDPGIGIPVVSNPVSSGCGH